MLDDDDKGFLRDESDKLKRVLNCHFLPGNLTRKKLKDRMLLETVLEEIGLKGGHQVLEVQVSDVGKDSKGKGIAFGGATALREPCESHVCWILRR